MILGHLHGNQELFFSRGSDDVTIAFLFGGDSVGTVLRMTPVGGATTTHGLPERVSEISGGEIVDDGIDTGVEISQNVPQGANCVVDVARW